MTNLRTLGLGAAAVLALGWAPAQATTMLSAQAGSLCGPGGCFSDKTTTFRQTFAASQFGGPAEIGALALQRGILGAMEATAFKVTFELADGTTVADWGHYTIAVLGGETVMLDGGAFTWDTARGDLILKLDLVVPDKGGGGGGFGGGFGGGGSGSAFALPLPTGSDLAQQLLPSDNPVAQFVAAAAVPEPATWGLMIAGFGGAGVMLRRRAKLAPRFG